MVKFYAAWSASDLAKIARDLANTHYFKIPTTADEFKEEAATSTTSVVRLILGLFRALGSPMLTNRSCPGPSPFFDANPRKQ